jgi:hypothetical protein
MRTAMQRVTERVGRVADQAGFGEGEHARRRNYYCDVFNTQNKSSAQQQQQQPSDERI